MSSFCRWALHAAARLAAVVSSLAFAGPALAQPDPSEPGEPEVPEPELVPPEDPPPPPAPPEPAPTDPLPSDPVPTVPPVDTAEEEAPPAPRMSEGRLLVSLYNSGFQWGLAPGVVFSAGKAGFFLGLRLGYGIDTGPVIVVPGVRLAGFFLDPNVYLGMPVLKLIVPIDRFAPFVEGGTGVGHVSEPAGTGVALLGGGGFMVHVSPAFAIGAEANYQTITGTGFRGFGVGPILAIGF